MKRTKESSKSRNSSAGITLLAAPLFMVSFTAAMVHAPPRKPAPPSAAETLGARNIERSVGTAIGAAADDDLLPLRLLHESGFSLSAAAVDGRTALMAAAAAGARETARWLIDAAAVPLETRDDAGLTALAHAVAAGETDLVTLLAEAGADPEAKGCFDRPPLLVASHRKDPLLLRTLLATGVRAGLGDALSHAVASGQLKTAEVLLTAQSELRTAGAGVQRAELLGEAARDSDPERAGLLISHQAPLDLPNASGITPIGTAIAAGDLAMCRLLVEAGADLDAPCNGEATPLALAWGRRDLAMAEALLQGGAAPHPGVLVEAADAAEKKFARLLAVHGVPLSTRLTDGETPLTRALSAGKLEVASELLELGASPEDVGRHGQPALAAAVARGDAAAVRLLLDAGADPNRELLHPAHERFHHLAANKILSYYLKRDRRFTPLMVAAAGGDGDVIRSLLDAGASRGNYTKSWKRYPISFASEAKHILAQQLLVGYDPDKQEDHYKVTIALSTQRATLYKNGRPIDSSPVSTGRKGYRTPTGEYVVTHKHRHHTSNLYGAPMPYFMRLSCGAFGTHTGHCPGYPASHGCIRMPDAKAKRFFATCPAGTPVSIVP